MPMLMDLKKKLLSKLFNFLLPKNTFEAHTYYYQYSTVNYYDIIIQHYYHRK